MTKPDDKPQSKQSLYQIASRHSRSAINRLVELMYSKNENVALGATKALLSKTLPDLKRIESVAQEGSFSGKREYEDLSDDEINKELIRLSKGLPVSSHL